jgi:hypothetical protein
LGQSQVGVNRRSISASEVVLPGSSDGISMLLNELQYTAQLRWFKAFVPGKLYLRRKPKFGLCIAFGNVDMNRFVVFF